MDKTLPELEEFDEQEYEKVMHCKELWETRQENKELHDVISNLEDKIKILEKTIEKILETNSKKRIREEELITSGERIKKIRLNQNIYTECPECGMEVKKRDLYRNKLNGMTRHTKHCVKSVSFDRETDK
jgi:hypothetical protein